MKRLLSRVLAMLLLHTVFMPSLQANEEGDLGALLYGDPNLSLHRNQSCANCHGLQPVVDPRTGRQLPAPGFVDPENVRNHTPVSKGSIEGRFGSLNAPSIAYAGFSPIFSWDGAEETFVGGQFWNGRAADLTAQAGEPFLNPAEMALPSRWAVVSRIRENPAYVSYFEKLYGIRLLEVPSHELAPADLTPPASVIAVFQAATQAIAEFERGPAFHKFNSKFDFWVVGLTAFSASELRGFNLFTNTAKANCAACHPHELGRDDQGRITPPLFTDFTYDNIGLPRNDRVPGRPAPSRGLADRAEILSAPNGAAQLGKHKVMTLRNIAVTAPYGHHGVFETLEQVVHFYNKRDTLGRVSSSTDPGFGITGWPEPEILENVNEEELGHLNLTPEEEADVVAFLRTLTDDYPEQGEDPGLPPGTPSPFAYATPPPSPVTLSTSSPSRIQMTGHLGRTYRLEVAEALSRDSEWSTVTLFRLMTNPQVLLDDNPEPHRQRYFRVVESP